MSSSIRSRSNGWRLCFLVLALWGLVPGPVAAAGLTEEAKAQAREKFNAGNAAYAQENYRQALESFEAAYQLAPLPGFLFNVAQCHRMLGNFTRAASSYRRFLELSEKEPANAAMVRELIAEMDAKAKEPPASRPAPAKPVAHAKAPAKDRPEAVPSKVPAAGGGKKEGGVPKESERKPLDIRTSRSMTVQEKTPLPPAAVPGPAAVPEQQEPLVRKWWVWAGAGAVAAVAGGIIYAVASPEPRSPTLGTISGP